MSEDSRNFDDELRTDFDTAIRRMTLEDALEALVQTHDFTFGDAVRFFSGRQGPVCKRYAAYAHENYNDEGELEIDENAIVSLGTDRGAYVMAWQWVDDGEVGVTPLEQEQEMAA